MAAMGRHLSQRVWRRGVRLAPSSPSSCRARRIMSVIVPRVSGDSPCASVASSRTWGSRSADQHFEVGVHGRSGVLVEEVRGRDAEEAGQCLQMTLGRVVPHAFSQLPQIGRRDRGPTSPFPQLSWLAQSIRHCVKWLLAGFVAIRQLASWGRRPLLRGSRLSPGCSGSHS